MNTLRVIENNTGKILVEEVMFGMEKFFVGAERLRLNWNNKVKGGCTIKGYYTTPDHITENAVAVINDKTFDCL